MESGYGFLVPESSALTDIPESSQQTELGLGHHMHVA